MFEDASGKEQLSLHAQRDMNTVVLNDRTTTVGGNHFEVVSKGQRIHINMERHEEISLNHSEVLKQKETNVGEAYQVLVDKNIILNSNKTILIKTQGAYIDISPRLISIKSDLDIGINAEVISFNE